ncbi:twitching motility protein PilT [Clostridia bacterium]|nr:twitching motility protein PilT [Clostridia bacterium]
MKYLLDTHVLLWWLENSPKLSKRAVEVLVNPEEELYYSVASTWEITLKHSMGKLRIEGGVSSLLLALCEKDVKRLGVETWHLECLDTLPFIHRDPFDRMLIATANAEGMTLVTADENIRRYNVEWLW